MDSSGEPAPAAERPAWSLLSPHGLVLFFVAMKPESTLREMSEQLGLTERTLYSLIKDLSGADMLRTAKVGRRHSYTVNAEARFVHPHFAHLRLASFFEAFAQPQQDSL